MAKKDRPKIHASVRHGGAVYLKDNDDHAEMLAEAAEDLGGRACRRLLNAEAISGEAFEKVADAWEKDNKKAAAEAARIDEEKQARRESARPWAHPPGTGNTSTQEAAKGEASKDEKSKDEK